MLVMTSLLTGFRRNERKNNLKMGANERRYRICSSKRKYPTWTVAERHALRITYESQALCLAYRCPLCRSWHVGHAPRFISPRRAAR